MNDEDTLVSVVVPAFNAAKTIHETLQSISQQTYRALDVVVVDDGSIDETAAIVRSHSMSDPRFRIVSKPNGGVASARNEGIKASKGAFIAFIDADDLWHPTKIEKQLTSLISGGPDTALVYSPFRLIDADGNVRASPHKYGVSGWVIYRHFYTNLVGNGSALLIRKTVLEELGGFDSWLRHEGAEGCEDLLLQLRIAARYRFGEVSEYLVGYRKRPDSMSSNTIQMIRSGVLAVNQALSECRDVPGLSALAMLRRYELLRIKSNLREGRLAESLRDFARELAISPLFVMGALWAEILTLASKMQRLAASTVSAPSSGNCLSHFYDLDPKSGIDLYHRTATSRALRRLATLDQAYRPNHSRSHLDGSSKEIAQARFGPRDLNCYRTYQKGQG